MSTVYCDVKECGHYCDGECTMTSVYISEEGICLSEEVDFND